MSLNSVFHSKSQRRFFICGSLGLTVLVSLLYLSLHAFVPETRGWNAVLNILNSIVASAVFALSAILLGRFFFVDTDYLEKRTRLLPQDIDDALKTAANSASDYRIYVRTGRHFRAVILPILLKNAIKRRSAMKIEVILLDFRDQDICQKYASYRARSSFDRKSWDLDYTRAEIMATIIALMNAKRKGGEFLDLSLFLSSRLSTFRIEGSSDEIIITREDPKDMAIHIPRADADHAAFVTEFNWIRDSAEPVALPDQTLGQGLRGIFGDIPVIEDLEKRAQRKISDGSPYAR